MNLYKYTSYAFLALFTTKLIAVTSPKIKKFNKTIKIFQVRTPSEKTQSGVMGKFMTEKSTAIKEVKRVVCLSINNLNNKNGTAVLFFPGFSNQGGILLNFFESFKDRMDMFKNISKFMMVQLPGMMVQLPGRKLLKYESDAIKDSPLALVEQDMEILKEIKKAQNNKKLHLVGFSWGGLRAINAYLSLNENDRQGISLSLADPFIPTLTTKGQYYHDKNLLYAAKSIMPKYLLNKTLNKLTGGAGVFIKHCWAQEDNMRKKLGTISHKTLNILGIYLMKNGFGASEDYKNFFQNEVAPKCLENNIIKIYNSYQHLDFLDNFFEFLLLINNSLKDS